MQEADECGEGYYFTINEFIGSNLWKFPVDIHLKVCYIHIVKMLFII